MVTFRVKLGKGLPGPFAPGMLRLPSASSQKFLRPLVKPLTSEAQPLRPDWRLINDLLVLGGLER